MNRDHFEQQEHEAEQSRRQDKIELAERMRGAPEHPFTAWFVKYSASRSWLRPIGIRNAMRESFDAGRASR